MDIINPFCKKGNWFKGNLHTHTKNSDGQFTPEETCVAYSKAGYHFLAITDHNKLTKEVKAPDNLLLIDSCELDTNGYHIVGIDMKEEVNKEGLSPQQLIDSIKQQGAIVILAHPYWSGLTSSDILQIDGYDGIEIYNTMCHRMQGKGYSSVHIDEILQAGKRFFCFAADDCHRESDISGGFIMVNAESHTKRDILTSIKKGLFYASTGLFIKDIIVENKKIKVHCSPAETIDFIGYNASGERIASDGPIEYAEYEIKGSERYIRIEITDRYGKKAWTNPIIFL
jgi:hypothetical protein